MTTPAAAPMDHWSTDWARYFQPAAAGVEIIAPPDECDAWRALPAHDRAISIYLLERIGRRIARGVPDPRYRTLAADEIAIAYHDLTRHTGASIYLVRRAIDRLCAARLIDLRPYAWGVYIVHVPAWRGRAGA